MFRSCMFCHWDLGSNETIPDLPIGRVAAFDPRRGRLWVVCTHCAGWSLVPIDQRWEAVEHCESEWSGWPRRYSSYQIGMAVAPDGMRLIRIGEATAHEFACWRYEPRFRRRRIRFRLRGAGMAAASGVGFALVGGATYVTASAIAGTWLTLAALASLPSRRSELVAVVQERDGPASVFEGEIRDLRFVREGGVRSLRIGGAGYSLLVDEPHITDALGLILPHVNRRGGRPAEVARATDAIATAGGPGPYLESFAVDRVSIDNLGPASRLGLEMAAHETVEAAALDGELKVLQRRWQTAEKLAAISDGLFRDREEMLLARLKSDLTPVSRSS